MQRQTGFTLIELITVIVILGALAVVALPRYIDLQDEAEQAAAEGVAGAISAGAATNYAAYVAGSDDFSELNDDLSDEAAPASSELANLLQDSSALSNYQIGSACDLSGDDTGVSAQCELLNDDGDSFDPVVNFTAIVVDETPTP